MKRLSRFWKVGRIVFSTRPLPPKPCRVLGIGGKAGEWMAKPLWWRFYLVRPQRRKVVA